MRNCQPVRPLLKNLLFLFALLAGGCRSYQSQKDALPDNADRGSIHVSADESFKPIIDEHVLVYQSRHPKARILVEYKPEAECLKDLFNDSVRMVIVTRDCSTDEADAVRDSLKIGPKGMTLAFDAITLVVNPGDEDSLFTMKEVREILAGKFRKNLIPVFDGVKATSTVRFAIDSVLRGEPLSSYAVGASSSKGVIDYVASHPGSVGFIGVSWIGNPEDTSALSYLKRVRMASIESTREPGTFIKPSQLNIFLKRYPMVRDLVYILKENYKGLGTAFSDFMSGEIGQLIFKRAYLVPAQKDFRLRPVRLRE